MKFTLLKLESAMRKRNMKVNLKIGYLKSEMSDSGICNLESGICNMTSEIQNTSSNVFAKDG